MENDRKYFVISIKAVWSEFNVTGTAGVWDFMTGHLLFKLNNSALGAIITHGLVNEDGTFTVAAESGDVLYWDMKTRQVIFQAVFSTLIGPGLTRLGSHWSRASECYLHQKSYGIKNHLFALGGILLAGSLWHKLA